MKYQNIKSFLPDLWKEIQPLLNSDDPIIKKTLKTLDESTGRANIYREQLDELRARFEDAQKAYSGTYGRTEKSDRAAMRACQVLGIGKRMTKQGRAKFKKYLPAILNRLLMLLDAGVDKNDAYAYLAGQYHFESKESFYNCLKPEIRRQKEILRKKGRDFSHLKGVGLNQFNQNA